MGQFISCDDFLRFEGDLSLSVVVMNDFCLNFRLVKGRVIKLLNLITVSSNKLSRENGDLSLFYGKFILWPWPG